MAKFEYGAAQIEFENAADSSTSFAPASLNKSVNQLFLNDLDRAINLQEYGLYQGLHAALSECALINLS